MRCLWRCMCPSQQLPLLRRRQLQLLAAAGVVVVVWWLVMAVKYGRCDQHGWWWPFEFNCGRRSSHMSVHATAHSAESLAMWSSSQYDISLLGNLSALNVRPPTAWSVCDGANSSQRGEAKGAQQQQQQQHRECDPLVQLVLQQKSDSPLVWAWHGPPRRPLFPLPNVTEHVRQALVKAGVPTQRLHLSASSSAASTSDNITGGTSAIVSPTQHLSDLAVNNKSNSNMTSHSSTVAAAAAAAAAAGSDTLPLCPLVPLHLVGPLTVPSQTPSWSELCTTGACSGLLPGGHYRPPSCVARHRVAIIVPYRDREEHLRLFLYHMHPILQRQMLDYTIYVVEQYGDREFNRAALFNVGAVEAMKQYDYQCFVFHDVDLLPLDDRALYTCPRQPRHLSVAIDAMEFRLRYASMFGGVTSLLRQHYLLVNGFSNRYWGWGGEDDDMSSRLAVHQLHISRLPATVVRYHALRHRAARANPHRMSLLKGATERWSIDGLTSLSYQLKQLVSKQLFTWILADLA